jgi:hypothetical protein
MSIFQTQVTYNKQSPYGQGKMGYDNTLFYCPKVVAKDGFTVSLQVHNGNYCSSNNGYRTLGDTIKTVEFGFPSFNEPLMFKYAETYSEYAYSDEDDNSIPCDLSNFDITNTVGNIPIEVMEEVFTKHGGIDWEATISATQFNKFINDK